VSENKDRDENEDRSITSEGNSSGPRKTWLIEWKNAFGKTLTEEKYDYTEALSVFEDKVASGRDAILYEVQKSAHDSSVVKKTPILNSVKARQRRRAESDSTKHDIQAKWRRKWINKASSLRYRIIILITVIGVLVLVISLIDVLTSKGGVMLSPHILGPIVDTTISIPQICQALDTYLVGNFGLTIMHLGINNDLKKELLMLY
jgi:uncharacterized membrane protein